MSDLKHTGEDNLLDCVIYPKDIIPHGPYCYFGSRNPADNSYKPCPYWSWVEKKNASCSYLGIEDNLEDKNGHEPMALWDQLKECDINSRYEEEPEVMATDEYVVKYGDNSE